MSIIQTIRHSVRTARMGDIPRWKPARVERLQERRLRRLVRWAAERSPFYARKFRDLDAGSCDFADLPTTTKDELMERFDQVVTDPGVTRSAVEQFMGDSANLGRWFQSKYAVSRTSGSQGRPLVIVQERRALELFFAILSSRANAFGKPTLLEAARRLAKPARIAIVTLQRGFFPSGAAFEFMQELVGPFASVQWISSIDRDLIERLNDFQPHALVAYASVLDALALQRDRLKLRELRQIGNSSEQLTSKARQRIESAFRVPLLDHYGTGECLCLSEGCPTDGGAHINTDWVVAEVVDADYRPVEDGQTGSKLLITNLANRVQPFIRYEVEDRVAMATTPCRCGNRLPRIARIDGRTAQLFWVWDGGAYRMVSGSLFASVADSFGEIREWQAIQRERNRIEINLEPLRGASFPGAITARFADKLLSYGLPRNVQVDVRIVATLAPDGPAGKFRRVYSEIGPPADLSVTSATSEQLIPV